MKRLMIIVMVLLVSACDQTIHDVEIRKAQQYCSDKSGVHSINTQVSTTVLCWDYTNAVSDHQNLSEVKLEK